MCRVLNKHGAGVPAEAIYIARGSKWGNPFRIGAHGDRAAVITKHESWLRDQHHLLRALDELRGSDPVCFRAPLACHGDLLLWLAGATRGERIAWWRGLSRRIAGRARDAMRHTRRFQSQKTAGTGLSRLGSREHPSVRSVPALPRFPNAKYRQHRARGDADRRRSDQP
jgi:hypothetical protein